MVASGDPCFLRGRRRCPRSPPGVADSVRFEASGKLGKCARGHFPRSRRGQFPDAKEDQNPWAEWRERKSWRQEKGRPLFL